MHATKPKLILAVGAVLSLTMFGALFFAASKKPDFRLSFVCATNDSAGFCFGVFRLENHSKNYAGIASGEFEIRSGFGWVPAGAAFGGPFGAKPFGPQLVGPGTITFKTTLPAATNQYRLVVDIVPFASVNGLAISVPPTNNLEYRIGTRLARYNLLSVLPSKLQMSLLSNTRHLNSESFLSPARNR
jgi:hypothetical protein